MNDDSLYELEELAVQPGTYFNPQTEVVVIVDDSASVNLEIFDPETFEGSEWVRVAEDIAVDEEQRDEMIEEFQARHHASNAEPIAGGALDPDDPDLDEPDPEEPPAGIALEDEAI
ncbi:MAG: hypothetical protein ACSLFD_02580 [Solirubrobacterales bacterium]